MRGVQASILAALALSACAPTAIAQPPVRVGSGSDGRSVSVASVTIPIGGQAILNQLTLRPIAVVEDSRCPMDAVCVWAGRLIVTVEIDLRGGSETLRTNLTAGQSMAIAGGSLTLVGSVPAKRADTPPPANFIFRFERG